MRLVIQIPCLDEADTLATTVRALPRQLDGIDEVLVVVVDDGSSDETARVAEELGVDRVVRHSQNLGLARAYMTGMNTCLDLGADVIVNTDADNQYRAEDLPALIEPILAGRADMVIGTRPIASIEDFSPMKKQLQRLGSWAVRRASGVDVTDAPSGFRALSRTAAQRVNVFSDYTYTLETIVQAGQNGLAVECVPVRVNPATRPSRLARSSADYVLRSILTLLRITVTYRPMRFLMALGAVLMALGGLLGVRFLFHYAMGEGDGHVQSLILAAIVIPIGFQTCVLAVVADLISVNRRLLEDVQARARRTRDTDWPRRP